MEIERNSKKTSRATQSLFLDTQKDSEKKLEKMVHQIETSTQLLNCIQSNNSKRRQKIDDMRKHRALFDKVFKGLEESIYQEEKKIIAQIKSLRLIQKKAAKVEKDLEKLRSALKKNHKDDLAEQIEEVYHKNFVEYDGYDEDDERILNQLSPQESEEEVPSNPPEPEPLGRLPSSVRNTRKGILSVNESAEEVHPAKDKVQTASFYKR